MRVPPRHRSGDVVALLLLLSGCTDLTEFRGTFEGQAVGGEGDDSFIRRGFPPDTTLTLTFDPTRAAEGAASPGTLTTDDGRFQDTPLLTIVPLRSDQLSQYDFPGGGRLRNYIFHASSIERGPDAPARDALVFVSLMERERIELRVIAGPGDDAGDLFGLWTLRNRAEP